MVYYYLNIRFNIAIRTDFSEMPAAWKAITKEQYEDFREEIANI